MGHRSGTSDRSLIDRALEAVIREHATQVRLAAGLSPQIYWIAPYRSHDIIYEADMVVALYTVGKLTSDDIRRFAETVVPHTKQRELEDVGETRFEFEFAFWSGTAMFSASASKKEGSLNMMIRLLSTR